MAKVEAELAPNSDKPTTLVGGNFLQIALLDWVAFDDLLERTSGDWTLPIQSLAALCLEEQLRQKSGPKKEREIHLVSTIFISSKIILNKLVSEPERRRSGGSDSCGSIIERHYLQVDT